MIAKQLAGTLFVVRDSVILYQGYKVRRCVSTQRGNTKIRVRRDKSSGVAMKIGEITAAATGHEYFLANPVRALQDQNAPPAIASRNGAHKSGRAAAKNDDIVSVHGRNIAGDPSC